MIVYVTHLCRSQEGGVVGIGEGHRQRCAWPGTETHGGTD